MQSEFNQALADTLGRVGVVPVLTIESAEAGVAVARALARGGLDVIEVTLRTPAAIEAIRRIRAEVPLARVGAGTVLTPEQADAAIEAGARFIVSPGMTPRLVAAAEGWAVPFLPGAVTASEALALADLGYRCQKFFPAEAAGGVAMLKALAAPLSGLSFCPTGGIDAGNARDYLALANVVAVGGSWVAPAALARAGDWERITALASVAASLRRSA
jgi:2-dehydro-3-deoxyphosphogluconate aldolase/(4S)-4-hydroxy-2-oxoglutarate aldolase